MRIAINGFGRIGRLVLRRLEAFPDVNVVAINDLAEAPALAYLFNYDSVHGRGSVKAQLDGNHLVWGERRIGMLSAKTPAIAGWGRLGVDTVIEASGAYRRRESVVEHIQAGVRRVVVTAPLPGADRTVVMGVNDHLIDLERDHIVSNASCTTNCIAPVANVLQEAFGIISLAFTTVHAYTSSQSLVDTPMRKLRRGRAAALSMVPTSTGASDAIAEVIPALAGKVAGTAVRVPVPDGSTAPSRIPRRRNRRSSEGWATGCSATTTGRCWSISSSTISPAGSGALPTAPGRSRRRCSKPPASWWAPMRP